MLANFGFAVISIFLLHAVLACGESDSAQCWPDSRKNEFLSKTILACLSVAQMASIHKIKNDKKSGDTAPLSWGIWGSGFLKF